MSSKYGLQAQVVLDTLTTMLESRNFAHNKESHIMMIHDVRDDLILQVPGQEQSMSSKYRLCGHMVLDTHPIMIES